ncbi:MAG TPA: DNA-processing protein DprA [Candidatus Dorea intestinavium]|nr:DNA-processing protein DprA [Candidatus Dorea intestinavium]
MHQCEYELWLGNLKGLSLEKKIRLKEIFKSAKFIYNNIEETPLVSCEILSAKEKQKLIQSKKELENYKKEAQRLKRIEAFYLPFDHPAYPKRLREIKDKPYGLYVKGGLPKEEVLSVAIIGARSCSTYGEIMALEISRALAKRGVQIISGLAAGIDGLAHQGTIAAKGETYGVLGCGLNVCYPYEHQNLYEQVASSGGIISEYPLDTPPKAYNFPRRNRIISGLSDVLIIIEAKIKSGTLITTDYALEQGRDIYALPGPVTSKLSAGCNRLISQGAGIITSVEELLFNLQVSSENPDENNVSAKKTLETDNNIVYSCLDFYPKNLESLIVETNLSPSRLMEELVMLEIEGLIKEISKNNYVKVKT